MNTADGKCLTDGLRPSQRAVVDGYNGGRMGISAVPGSGKTYTLSMLAACLILDGALDMEQEVLIVTFSNSAVNNFAMRIGSFLDAYNLLPGLGYRVRTLHGLAHDIVRENPGRLNLANDFTIIDEIEANKIREAAAEAWLSAHPDFFDNYLKADLEEHRATGIKKMQLPGLVQNIAKSLIRYAKDRELTPDAMRQGLDGLPAPLPLAEMGWAVYQEYHRSLAYRGAVDFDDLIRLALAALRGDRSLVERLQEQWPYILEDEAQDSSRLQEEILRVLAGDSGNWVRVGDPNQAINETFTTANPQYLIDFINSRGTVRRDLPVSGRSTRSIIALANHLIDWVHNEHPAESAREALRRPYIEPTEPGDPQTNPPDEVGSIYLHPKKMTPEQEMDGVIGSLLRWQQLQDNLPAEERETLAVLDLKNDRGTALANALRGHNVDPVEVLNTTTSTRRSADTLSQVLRYLANPQSQFLLPKAYSAWRSEDRRDTEARPINKRAVELLRKLKNVEDYLYPLPGEDWLEGSGIRETEPAVFAQLSKFRTVVRRWHSATLLPIDQVVLTIAQDLFCEPADLAIAHKLAGMLRQKANSHPDWRLPEHSGELESIAQNKRRFIGFSDDDNGFDPEKYRGRIVITTMHKAKGLEWDRVYLLSCNNYNFPSGDDYDQYVPEKWFLREQLNLEAEALAQLKVALSKDLYEWYEEGRATREARIDIVRERLRLLYVGITRAKKSLFISWNSGNNGKQLASRPFLDLHEFIEAQRAGAPGD